MALIEVEQDSWEAGLHAAERLHRSILASIGDRGRLARSSHLYSQATQNITSLVTGLGEQVAQLQSSLAAQGSHLTGHELNRRRDLVDSLHRKERALRDQVHCVGEGGTGSRARAQLLGTQAGLADLGTSGWGEHTPPHTERQSLVPNRTGVTEDHHTQGKLTAQVREEQESLLAEQDQGLDMLHQIVVRQKGMGQQIFREVTTQNELIDDIGDRTDNVNARLLATTGDIRVVERKDQTCCYWTVILLLAIAIIVVLLV